MALDRRSFAESLGIRPTALQPPTPTTDPDAASMSPTTQATRVRPADIENMIGQWELRSQVLVKVRAAKMRHELPNHFLFYGSPGLGKTTLAKIVAHELDAPLRSVEATSVDTPTKMANALGELDANTVFFIDEIHGLPRKAQEMLGLAMEDLQITVSVGTNRNNTTTQTIKIQPFVCVGATTLAGNLTGPLRDRFGFVGNLVFYEDEELSQIVERASQLLPNKIEADAAIELASRSRGTPRVALNLLSKVADYAVVSSGDDATAITIDHVDEGLSLFDIDAWGMNPTDRRVLKSLCVDHMGGPVGAHRIAASTSVEQRTLIDVIEPFLIRAGMLRNTSRGRVATPKAFKVFGLKVPPFLQRMSD